MRIRSARAALLLVVAAGGVAADFTLTDHNRVRGVAPALTTPAS
jgi:hypothetical protein